MTPYQAYVNVKRNHPLDIVFVRVGDQFHTYNNDALDAAQVLGIEVGTIVDPDDQGRIIPHTQLPARAYDAEGYVRKFIIAGKGMIIMEPIL